MFLANRVPTQKKRQDKNTEGRKVYCLHAPEVECIGKGKAHAPYGFGVKLSLATTLHRSKGGQFAIHAMALPGTPYDGHTLKDVIPGMQAPIGNEIKQILADAGYRGHNAPGSHRFPRLHPRPEAWRVSRRQKTDAAPRRNRTRHRSRQERAPRMGRNYLAHTQGDRINAILAAAKTSKRVKVRFFTDDGLVNF